MYGRKVIIEVVEIDENRIRSPLTPAQEAAAIFRSKATLTDCGFNARAFLFKPPLRMLRR
jgi:hypothetical protein